MKDYKILKLSIKLDPILSGILHVQYKVTGIAVDIMSTNFKALEHIPSIIHSCRNLYSHIKRLLMILTIMFCNS